MADTGRLRCVPDFDGQEVVDESVRLIVGFGAHAQRYGPGHLQQRLAEYGLPSGLVVAARYVLRAHQTLAAVRRDRRQALRHDAPLAAASCRIRRISARILHFKLQRVAWLFAITSIIAMRYTKDVMRVNLSRH